MFMVIHGLVTLTDQDFIDNDDDSSILTSDGLRDSSILSSMRMSKSNVQSMRLNKQKRDISKM